MALFLFAIAAGFLTVLAPCILPVLPIILGTGVQASRARPLFVVAGFVLSFSVIGAAFATAGSFLGISQETVRILAVVLLLLFGLSMLFEKTYLKLTANVSARLNRLGGNISAGSVGKSSAWSGLPVGISLGLIWTPCAGPILGTILTLAATQRDFLTTAILFAAYSAGAGLPMLGIAYSGGWLFERLKKIGARTDTLNKLFGLLVIAAALAIAFGFDRVIQAALVRVYPSDASAPSVPVGELPKLGPMPEIAGISRWLNGGPLTKDDLKGKVVLVDFMTYSCINCIRTFPYLNAWYDKYKDDGLVIVGIHTPEFEFEKNADNVRKALGQFGIKFPVGLDNDYRTWTNFNNRYWPAKYLFDRDGELRLAHFGEGNYGETEAAIQQLLGVREAMTDSPDPNLSGIRSPETYFGYARAERFASPQRALRDKTATYAFPPSLAPNQWALSGDWTVGEEFAESQTADASLEFRFSAGSANLVMSSADGKPKAANATIDGTDMPSGPVEDSKLYEFRAEAPGDHLLTITVEPGVRVYAITFGE